MIKFRPYQQAAIEAGLRCFEKATDSFIIQLPTGGGKTPTGMKIAVEGSKLLRSRGCGGRILWVAHRDYLLKQAASALKLIDNSLQTAWWTADKKEERGDITFCMIGSTRTLEGEYDIVVFDEAHHFAEEDEEYDNMYSKLCKRIKWKYRIGLTATPGRSDTRKLSFEKVAYSIPFFDLVKKHRLAKPIYVEMPTKQRFHLQMRGGDFTRTSLKTLDDPERNAKIVKEWVNGREKYGKTILFAPSVQAAIDIQKEVAHQSPTTESGVIYGEMGDAEKAAVLEWFKAGNSKTPKILLNCMIFTEGYDESSIKTVIVARPTMSKTLWMQMVGRGSRIVTERALLDPQTIRQIAPAGDDGISLITFTNDWSCHGEIIETLENGLLADLHIDDEFYLINVMDDITHYANLIQEWTLDLYQPTEVQLLARAIKQEVLEARTKIEKVCEDEKVDDRLTAELSDAQVRDVVGIIIFSDKMHKRLGVPLDIDRFNCLRRLMDFAETCKDGDHFDMETYAEAYSFCVLKGEIPFKLFESLRWAFYYKFVLRRDRIEYLRDGRMYDTWNVIPLKEMTAASREEYVRNAKIGQEEAERANKAFNEKYTERKALAQLVKDVLAKAHELIPGSDSPEMERKALGMLSMRLGEVKAVNRRLRVGYEGEVTSYKTLSLLNRSANILTSAIQIVLDDPTALVTVLPKKVSFNGR